MVLAAAAWLLCAASWASGEALAPGTYEITARTLMPHLEENLRYAATRERRCLLACASPQVATGNARLDTARGRISGSLEIKMGGKNMTFSQRIDAVRHGNCTQ